MGRARLDVGRQGEAGGGTGVLTKVVKRDGRKLGVKGY